MKLNEIFSSNTLIEDSVDNKKIQQVIHLATRTLLDDMDTDGKDEDLVDDAWNKACKQMKQNTHNKVEYNKLLNWFKSERQQLRDIMKKPVK